MRPEITKSQRRRIRELAGMAYDRELSRELAGLEEQFKRWHSGEITAHDVDDQIHRFHQGPHRQLFTTYTGGTAEFAVAAAIAHGIISEAEAGPDMLEIFRAGIESARRWSQEENDDHDDSGQG